MSRVIPFGQPVQEQSPQAFADALQSAAAAAIQAGATAAVLVFFDGTKPLPPARVQCPWPMARGMVAEAHDYFGSNCAGLDV